MPTDPGHAPGSPLLAVEDLSVSFDLEVGRLNAVRGLSFRVERGRTLAIVGESGCGKSITSLAIMGLLPRKAAMTAGALDFQGRSLLGLSQRRLADLRGDRLAMIFQEPMTALNPAYTVGDQLMEPLRRHRRAGRAEARERAEYLLEKVGITGAATRLRQYPHQLSGGLRQRVVIAMALMCAPDLVIADEPTTALDVTIQAQILHLLKELQDEFHMGLVLITHDLGVVARVADEVAVMYAGEIVEQAPAAELFDAPLHPYTQGLLACMPQPGRQRRGARLGTISGVVPSLVGRFEACAFAERCPYAEARCRQGRVALRQPRPDHAYRCLLAPDASRARAWEFVS
ncbi:peptide ABC transporter substrate-binding protein [Phormidium willei BDU 130791]|nr:peptide ABC transporter substrate-binding protein [Phormidium willei BDU 130791]